MRFRDHVHAGDILALAGRYAEAGADELVFYDIGASPRGATVDRGWVRRVARLIDIPFCVAGGIRSEADAERVLNAGAEKVSINTPALENPTLIDRLSRRFGAQCVVVGIDSRRTPHGLRAWMRTGDARRACDSGRDVVSWVREVQERGAGEIVLNCMDADGVRSGYDLAQLSEVRRHCAVPLIASGGAGCEEDFAEAFARGADGALAAGVFHSGALAIGALKTYLRGRGIEVRP